MFEPLSTEDLARLHAKFVLPIVVDSMLREEEVLDDAAEYAFNEILFELCPDTALLCIALCAAHIGAATAQNAAGRALRMEAVKIAGDYGPLWLAHESDPDGLDNAHVRRLLSYIPEDFEYLRDLLDRVMESLEEDHSIAAILCDILSFQADHHAALAGIELETLHLEPCHRPERESETSNVIPFRARS